MKKDIKANELLSMIESGMDMEAIYKAVQEYSSSKAVYSVSKDDITTDLYNCRPLFAHGEMLVYRSFVKNGNVIFLTCGSGSNDKNEMAVTEYTLTVKSMEEVVCSTGNMYPDYGTEENEKAEDIAAVMSENIIYMLFNVSSAVSTARDMLLNPDESLKKISKIREAAVQAQDKIYSEAFSNGKGCSNAMLAREYRNYESCFEKNIAYTQKRELLLSTEYRVLWMCKTMHDDIKAYKAMSKRLEANGADRKYETAADDTTHTDWDAMMNAFRIASRCDRIFRHYSRRIECEAFCIASNAANMSAEAGRTKKINSEKLFAEIVAKNMTGNDMKPILYELSKIAAPGTFTPNMINNSAVVSLINREKIIEDIKQFGTLEAFANSLKDKKHDMTILASRHGITLLEKDKEEIDIYCPEVMAEKGITNSLNDRKMFYPVN